MRLTGRLIAMLKQQRTRMRDARRGFSLVEISATLAVVGAVMAGVWGLSNTSNQVQQAALLAKQANAVGNAAQRYIEQNKAAILADAGLTTLNSAICIKVTDSDSCATTLPSLKARGYLPADFPENTATGGQNSFHQNFRLFVRREDGGTVGQVDDNDTLTGLTFTEGGSEIPDMLGNRIIAGMGISGGFIFNADDPDPAGATGAGDATAVKGNAGAWGITLSDSGWSNIGSLAQQGHIAVLTKLLPSMVQGSASSCSAGSGGPTRVQVTTAADDTGSATSLAATFSTNVTNGNAIIVVVMGPDGDTAMDASAVTDNKGNTYQRIVYNNYPPGYMYGSWVYAAYNVTGGASTVVTVTPTTASRIQIIALEMSGIATASAADAIGEVTREWVSSYAITSTTPTTEAGEYALTTMNVMGCGSVNIESGWTDLVDPAALDQNIVSGMRVIGKQIDTAGVVTHTWSTSGACQYWGVLATFKTTSGCTAASGGGGGGAGTTVFVNKAPGGTTGGASSQSVTFTTLPSAADTILVGVATWDWGTSNLQPTSVTDNQGNTYFLVKSEISNRYYGTGGYIYAAYNIPAPSGTFTVTANFASSVEINLEAIAVTGLAASPLDQTGSVVVNSDNHTSTTVSTTTAESNTFAYAVHAGGMASYDVGYSTQADWTQGYKQNDAACCGAYSSVFRVLTSPTTVSHTWTYVDTGTDWLEAPAVIATFKCAAACTTASTSLPSMWANALNDLTDVTTDYASRNMFVGDNTGSSFVGGSDNTALGDWNLHFFENGDRNTMLGAQAGGYLVSGNDNVVSGSYALYTAATSNGNIAVGPSAGNQIATIGDNNIMYGVIALRQTTCLGSRNIIYSITDMPGSKCGNDNIGFGLRPFGLSPSIGNGNIALGDWSLVYINGDYNIGLGLNAGAGLENASGNVFAGISSGEQLDSGTANYTGLVGIGFCALRNLTSAGNHIVRLGYMCNANSAGDKSYSVAIGNASQNVSTTGQYNTSLGYQSLYLSTSGVRNTAIGTRAAGADVGPFNDVLAVGDRAAQMITSASGTTAIGHYAVHGVTTGTGNTGLGDYTLSEVSTGQNSTAAGSNALQYIDGAGSELTAVGAYALYWGSTGQRNSAIGTNAIYGAAWYAPLNGSDNTALGYNTLKTCQGACAGNTAIGAGAGQALTTNLYNTIIGSNAMGEVTSWDNATVIGYNAMTKSAMNSVAIGSNAGALTVSTNSVQVGYNAGATITLGSSNTIIGSGADATAGMSNSRVAIGYGASSPADDNYIFGNGSVTSIGGYTGWTYPSDRRLKHDIQPLLLSADFIKSLRPVSFRALANPVPVRYGFIAQEVLAALGGLDSNLVQGSGDLQTRDYYSLTMNMLVAPVVNTIQAGQKQLEQEQQLTRNLVKMHHAAEQASNKADGLLAQAAALLNKENMPKGGDHD